MRISGLGRSLVSALAALMLAAGTLLFADAASAAPDGTIELELSKAGFIVGDSGGTDIAHELPGPAVTDTRTG
jgi:ABC-type sugar transport system substrate-binding protein